MSSHAVLCDVGGSFIISDDLATVSPGRMRVAQQLLPASNISAVPLDLLDKEMPELLRLQLGKHRVSKKRDQIRSDQIRSDQIRSD